MDHEVEIVFEVYGDPFSQPSEADDSLAFRLA